MTRRTIDSEDGPMDVDIDDGADTPDPRPVSPPSELTAARKRDAEWAAAEFDGVEEHPDTQCSADADRHLLLGALDTWRALAAAPQADAGALDVERLGFADLLSIGEALLEHYPPHTIVCTHNPDADIGARTTAAIGDLIASCRAALAASSPATAGSPRDDVAD